MTTAVDPRISALISFRDPTGQDNRTRAVVVWPGHATTAYHGHAMAAKNATDAMLTAAADAANARGLSPREATLKRQEAGSRAIGAINDSARSLNDARARVRRLLATATSVADYAASPGATILLDFRRVDRYQALPVSERAAIAHEVAINPTKYRDLAECALRQPSDLSPFEPMVREQIRIGLLKADQPDAFAQLEAERAQVNAASEVMAAAVDCIREMTGVMPEPQAHAGAVGFLVPQPALNWIDPAIAD